MGLISNIFGRVANREHKKIEAKLAKDPEYMKLDSEIKELEEKASKIQNSPHYKRLMDSLDDLDKLG